ncbi:MULTISPECIES: LpqB family beta-propeller domain-containing protein [Myxococcus]|uniref:Translocation protein TolB n=1 Tax=Myxococcus llanfairpwllgwyngyllgogerychwyrndrobwllllantysiliogogogochensis TaxID=2590453 RepID=A0A540X2E6_9BACT|nr:MULTISPECIES: LpqB family beta-propeller domain-containing protein [Myxococcus]NTX00618.1 PD40 domain-containing protein [Myxococcus sp. CA040A]NTX12680.1 PD40 domain-containing protein [Myxococcus sp. CA056]NTX33699.1 PD40 domain-containing protein [Myxococcus sp. CA033]NTX55836.1 PD40 domain-containing protein [Myxococcus sp. CA039A]TQF15438.1 translocation protein TolB [Myxococcus llanfairpwllgwyngyllgogerychwyrndrobwllllantysiliogogogochensis]
MKALLLSLVLVPLAAFAQTPTIEISGANFRPLPVAVPAPITQNEGAKAQANTFDTAFNFDLVASGILQVLDRKSFTADPKEGMAAGTITFSRWADVGAEALVKVSLADDAGTLRGELRLFNVGTGREDLKVAKDAPANNPSLLAHRLADALYRHFTREPSPFLSRITYVRKAGNNRDVVVADWDGGNPVSLTKGGINILPSLSQDGAQVAYTSYRKNRPDIWVQRPGGEARSVVSAGQMATGGAFSPDGKRLAYSLAEGESAQIYVSGADGSGAKAITDTPYGLNTSPAWSPDGKRIAFVSNRGGSPQIYIMGADGSGVRRLTFQGNYNQTPDWSPRGDLIVFTARDERNAFDLFTIHVESGKVTRLTQDQGNNEEPAFSPNGRLVLFSTTRAGGSQLFVMTADGNNQLPLRAEKGTLLTPDWAPLADAQP